MSELTLEEIEFDAGKHKKRGQEMCVMEVIAWLAGEKHTDTPECVCPVLGEFCRAWHDSMESNLVRRDVFFDRIPQILKAFNHETSDIYRAGICLNRLMREYLPLVLSIYPYGDSVADKLRQMPEQDAEWDILTQKPQGWDEIAKELTELSLQRQSDGWRSLSTREYIQHDMWRTAFNAGGLEAVYDAASLPSVGYEVEEFTGYVDTLTTASIFWRVEESLQVPSPLTAKRDRAECRVLRLQMEKMTLRLLDDLILEV